MKDDLEAYNDRQMAEDRLLMCLRLAKQLFIANKGTKMPPEQTFVLAESWVSIAMKKIEEILDRFPLI